MDKAQAIATVDWHKQVAALNQDSPSLVGTIRERLLTRMDPDIARSFSEAQLRELERALAAPASRRPAVDIRLTAPFFSRRYFITLLAGPEQRSQERLQDERARHTIWTVANTCLFAFLLLLFVPTLIGLVHIFANMG